MGSNKKIKDGLSRRKASSRVKTLLSDFAPSHALSLFFPRDVRALLPSDADMQQQYTLKHIRKYVCTLLVGVASMVGVSSESRGCDEKPFCDNSCGRTSVSHLRQQFQSSTQPSAPHFSRSSSSHSLQSNSALPSYDTAIQNSSLFSIPLGGQPVLRDSNGNLCSSPTLHTSAPAIQNTTPGTPITTVTVNNGPSNHHPNMQPPGVLSHQGLKNMIQSDAAQKAADAQQELANRLTTLLNPNFRYNVRRHEQKTGLRKFNPFVTGRLIVSDAELVKFFLNPVMPSENLDSKITLSDLTQLAQNALHKFYEKDKNDACLISFLKTVTDQYKKNENRQKQLPHMINSAPQIPQQNLQDYVIGLKNTANLSRLKDDTYTTILSLTKRSLFNYFGKKRDLRVIMQSGILETPLGKVVGKMPVGQRATHKKQKTLKRLQKKTTAA